MCSISFGYPAKEICSTRCSVLQVDGFGSVSLSGKERGWTLGGRTWNMSFGSKSVQSSDENSVFGLEHVDIY